MAPWRQCVEAAAAIVCAVLLVVNIHVRWRKVATRHSVAAAPKATAVAPSSAAKAIAADGHARIALIVLSSAHRPKMVYQTIASFEKHANYPIAQRIVIADVFETVAYLAPLRARRHEWAIVLSPWAARHENCGSEPRGPVREACAERARKAYNVGVTHGDTESARAESAFSKHPRYVRQMDFAFSLVDSQCEWVFILEDDWTFVKPDFIAHALAVLTEERGRMSNLHLDGMRAHRRPGFNRTRGRHFSRAFPDVEFGWLTSPGGGGGFYGSWSFQPGLVHLPTLYRGALNGSFTRYMHEGGVSKYLRQTHGLTSGALWEPYVFHAGETSHVWDDGQTSRKESRAAAAKKRKGRHDAR